MINSSKNYLILAIVVLISLILLGFSIYFAVDLYQKFSVKSEINGSVSDTSIIETEKEVVVNDLNSVGATIISYTNNSLAFVKNIHSEKTAFENSEYYSKHYTAINFDSLSYATYEVLYKTKFQEYYEVIDTYTAELLFEDITYNGDKLYIFSLNDLESECVYVNGVLSGVFKLSFLIPNIGDKLLDIEYKIFMYADKTTIRFEIKNNYENIPYFNQMIKTNGLSLKLNAIGESLTNNVIVAKDTIYNYQNVVGNNLGDWKVNDSGVCYLKNAITFVSNAYYYLHYDSSKYTGDNTQLNLSILFTETNTMPNNFNYSNYNYVQIKELNTLYATEIYSNGVVCYQFLSPTIDSEYLYGFIFTEDISILANSELQNSIGVDYDNSQELDGSGCDGGCIDLDYNGYCDNCGKLINESIGTGEEDEPTSGIADTIILSGLNWQLSCDGTKAYCTTAIELYSYSNYWITYAYGDYGNCGVDLDLIFTTNNVIPTGMNLVGYNYISIIDLEWCEEAVAGSRPFDDYLSYNSFITPNRAEDTINIIIYSNDTSIVSDKTFTDSITFHFREHIE